MPNAQDRQNAEKIKASLNLDSSVKINVYHGTRQTNVFRELGSGKDRSGKLTEQIANEITSAKSIEPRPEEMPKKGNPSIQVVAEIDGAKVVVYQQEREGTVTVNGGYEPVSDKAQPIADAPDQNAAATVEPKAVTELEQSVIAPAEVKVADVTLEQTSEKLEQSAAATVEAKAVDEPEKPAVVTVEEPGKLAVTFDAPLARQTPLERLSALERVTVQVVSSISKETDSTKVREALSNIVADIKTAKVAISAKAERDIETTKQFTKDVVIPRAQKDIAGTKEFTRSVVIPRVQKDVESTKVAAKMVADGQSRKLGKELTENVIAKVSTANAVKNITASIKKGAIKVENWVTKMTQSAHDREVSKAVLAKFEAGHDRTGSKAFSVGSAVISKEGDTIVLRSDGKEVVKVTVDENRKPVAIEGSKGYDINKIRAELSNSPKASSAVESRYQDHSKAIADLARRAINTQNGPTTEGKSSELPGKTYSFKVNENGDVSISKGGKVILEESSKGELKSDLSKADIERFSSAMRESVKEPEAAQR